MEVVSRELFLYSWLLSWLALKFGNENTHKTVVPLHRFSSITQSLSTRQLAIENT
jgi:hypothetical protein